MRIVRPGRTYIFIEPRGTGVTVRQGSSWLNLNDDEIDELFAAITELRREHVSETNQETKS